jgi:ParB family chromosome partitioning protein
MPKKMKVIGKLYEIPLELITVSTANVRDERRAVGLDDLKQSIKRIGLIQPISAYATNGNFEVIVGQRRLLAYKELQQEDAQKYGQVKTIVIQKPDDRTARLMSLVENLQRNDLTAREKTKACTSLLEELGTVHAVANALGWSPTTVVRWLKYAKIVPVELQESVNKNQMSRDDAMKISAATYPKVDRAVEIAQAMVKEKLGRPEKERLFEVARQNRSKPVKQLIIAAKKPKDTLTIEFHLVGIYKKGLERAARERDDRDINSLPQKIVQDWLDERGYTQ